MGQRNEVEQEFPAIGDKSPPPDPGRSAEHGEKNIDGS